MSRGMRIRYRTIPRLKKKVNTHPTILHQAIANFSPKDAFAPKVKMRYALPGLCAINHPSLTIPIEKRSPIEWAMAACIGSV
jgi:hypothetical protein